MLICRSFPTKTGGLVSIKGNKVFSQPIMYDWTSKEISYLRREDRLALMPTINLRVAQITRWARALLEGNLIRLDVHIRSLMLVIRTLLTSTCIYGLQGVFDSGPKGGEA